MQPLPIINDPEDVAAKISLGLAIVVAIVSGIRAGRNLRRADWVSFMLCLSCTLMVFSLVAILAGQWLDWKQGDNIVMGIVNSATLISIVPDRDFDIYNIRNTPNWTSSWRRPRYSLDLGMPVLASIAIGMLGTITGLTARGISMRRAVRKGHCVACGYDLTGAKHARCPECGENSPVDVLAGHTNDGTNPP